jgi:uncharacterized protein (UPF0210 family)
MPDIIQSLRSALSEQDAAKVLHIANEVVKQYDQGKIVELPFIAMVEQTLVNGKFKMTKGLQAFNGRYGVVYVNKRKWETPLIDICSDHAYDYKSAANELKKALKMEEKQC